uniref:Suppressor protein SRP40-like n=1 Tax=Anisakis simplex TaxID=6269 RepID=A0A0M3JFD9_ANISI
LFTFEKNITCDDDDNQYVPAAHDLLQETLPYSTHRSSYSTTTTTSPASTPTLTRFQPQVEFDNSSGTTESLLSDDATKSSITPQTSSLPLSLSWADDPAKTLSLHHANVSIDAPSTSTSVTLMITKTTPRPQQYVKKGLRPSGKRRNKKPGRRKNKTRHKFKDVQGDVHKANGEHTLASTTQIYQQFNDDNSSSSRPSTSSPPYSQYTSSQSQINHISSESHLHTSLATPTYSHSTLPSSIHDQQQQTTTSSALLVHFSITIIK